MTQQELKQSCLQLLEYTKNKLSPLDGFYYVDYKLIKNVCGKFHVGVFNCLGNSVYARYTDTIKGLVIEETKINDAIKSFQDQNYIIGIISL